MHYISCMKSYFTPRNQLIIILLALAGILMAPSEGGARTTILSPAHTYSRQIPDSLQKARQDSLLKRQQDSLLRLGQDSLGKLGQDSLLKAANDSISLRNNLSPKELKKLERQFIRDSIRAERDSLRNIPRMMETYYIPDSLQFRRTIAWVHDRYLNDPSFISLDTLMNVSVHDYAFMRNDVGATYLGVAGSATLYHNFFKRPQVERFSQYDPYIGETYLPETMPFYNTKSPYTLLSYAGNFLANKQKEETNIEVTHTQNLTPEFNFSFTYRREGGRGMLSGEATDNRSLVLGANHIGKRYIMHTGYIFNRVKRDENGGVSDEYFIRDTVVDVRTVPVHLNKAHTDMRTNTLFITHTYGVPLRIFKSDTLGVGEGTMVYFGHSGNYAVYSRNYTDQIASTDSVGRKFYNNNFYYHPNDTRDSTRSMRFDNRVFMRLQPWAKTAIVSAIDGGLGYEMLSNYAFSPEYYLHGTGNHRQNNAYFYASASGAFRQYIAWNALARLELAGYYQGDFSVDGNVRFSAYPLPQGVHLSARVLLRNYTPDWYDQYFYGNHHRWENNFSKITETRIEGKLNIPAWKMEATVGYALLGNYVYNNTRGLPQQASDMVNILSVGLSKNFKLGILRFDHRVLFQVSSNQDIIPLPSLSGNLRYYLQALIVRNDRGAEVLTVQIGAEVHYNSAYYAPAYDPDTGRFRTQDALSFGNSPYIDAFANFTWKRATIFVKYINTAQNWPKAEYFSALHYIRPQHGLKFGITWPFYVHP